MIKKVKNISEAEFILDNLREEDKAELYALYCDEWKKKTILSLEDKEFYIFYIKNKQNESIPSAMGGFYQIFDEEPAIACVWLLSSKFIYMNKLRFMKAIKKQIKLASSQYKIMFNFIYKSNFEAKKWLKKSGFKFDNPNPKNIKVPDGFEFFYKNI